MREIEFRARDIETDKFVYGSYIDHLEIIKNEHDTFDIDVYTLGQYTGLIDINGKEIFEGDIVKCKKRGNEHIVVVEWATLLAGYHLRYLDKHTYLCELCFAEDIEVIGNIYDNSELLEG